MMAVLTIQLRLSPQKDWPRNTLMNTILHIQSGDISSSSGLLTEQSERVHGSLAVYPVG